MEGIHKAPSCLSSRLCNRPSLLKDGGVRVQIVPGEGSRWLTIADYTDIMGNTSNYGEYQVLANLTLQTASLSSSSSSEYRRSLDLSTGIHTVTYEANGANFIQ